MSELSVADLATPDSIGLAAVVISLLGVIAGLTGVWYQVRRQWLLDAASTVTAFEERFISPQWKEYRVNCALFVRAHQTGELVDLSEDVQVLGMFEHMALLTRRRALDFEMVWNKFGWYIVRYYEGLTTGPRDLIVHIRQAEDDQTLWEELEWLYRRVVSEYRRRGVPVASGEERKRIDELFRQELTLLDYKETRLRPNKARSLYPPDQTSGEAKPGRQTFELEGQD